MIKGASIPEATPIEESASVEYLPATKISPTLKSICPTCPMTSGMVNKMSSFNFFVVVEIIMNSDILEFKNKGNESSLLTFWNHLFYSQTQRNCK